MVRTVLSSVAMLAALILIGCGKSGGPRSDMPVKAGGGVDKKGNATKTADISLEDPNAKTKK
jgi:hypothetical protein